ncbi:MBL fold metallo-hydrolase [Saccharopolyspora sp. WRP15-2]|uniref:MBL fold metallo-hydrolase n=1 Tax=Saccharopolyspora oryzae TaxID=2997343 RepID=A0ABT4V326_9PSEU|nr:alkyl sulfatase dimerization domain-containing protein [Saccharopolyspora oryzae]MDA3628362.1 MBL fold metallo-hydrolase [Saccharopolyspora oryzae]
MTAPELDWDDDTDRQNATRGLLGRLDPCVIRDASGRVVWDIERWSFLAEDCPGTAHPGLWRQGRLNALDGLFEVVPGVYQIRGFDVSNMTLVEGDSGVVVVDPLISEECSAAGLALYRSHRGPRPVTGVVYTHSHADHFAGVGGVVDRADVAAERVPVLAPAGFMEHAVGENVFAGPAMLARARYMYGSRLPAGPGGAIGFGLGQGTSTGRTGLIAPTGSITRTGQEWEVDGVRMIFQLTPGTEAPSEMNFLLPEHGVLLVAENANHTLHNVLTLRGAEVRDARAWAGYLTETIQLFGDRADVLVGSHHWPTWGRAELIRFLSEQRDAYAYLHDQTVRLMNRGLTGAEIAEELQEFPPSLAKAWHARGYYGSLSHNSKAVYQRYMGWFDGNPAHLWQHPPAESARRYVEFMGGADAVVDKARKSFADGDLRWVAEVLAHVLFSDPDHAAARQLQAETFEELGYGAENGTWRNFYLSGAWELRRDPEERRTTTGSANLAMVPALSVEQLFQSWAVRLNGPEAAAHRILLRWEFTDLDETWTLLLANGVLTPIRGEAPRGEQPHCALRLERGVFDRILSGQADFPGSIAAGEVVPEGDDQALRTLLGLLEEPARSFPIALP